MSERPLVVICGPTASGKTGLAIQIAKAYDGEVISADSRAIYKGMDIGTAKPSLAEQDGIPHWGIDLVEPGQRFTVVDFKQYAVQKIADIRSRSKLPIIVGGTGLYVDSVIYDYSFPKLNITSAERERFEKMSLNALTEYCINNNIILPENSKNKRYVINNIMRNGSSIRRNIQFPPNMIVVAISTNKDVLRDRIEQRAAQIFSGGVLDEAALLAERYGWENEAMTGNIYPIARLLLAGKITLEEAKRRFVVADWRLARRQLTWLRRNKDLTWLPLEQAKAYIASKLADEH